MTHTKISVALLCILIIGLGAWGVSRLTDTQARILVVNPLPAQAVEIMKNSAGSGIEVECVVMDKARDFEEYDAVLMYGRGLYLDSLQMAGMERAAARGVKIFTSTLRNFSMDVTRNITPAQADTLQLYFRNPCRANYQNLLRYVSNIAGKGGTYEAPVILPEGMFYHLDAGHYFTHADSLTRYLHRAGLYNRNGRRVVLISGVNFPVEGNRAHIDTLVSRLTSAGYNVYPLSASGKARSLMLAQAAPDAVIYLPMGRLGDNALIDSLYDCGIPVFSPFPLTQTRSEWLDSDTPLGAGTLNARIVVPEIDGAMSPLCIATQDPDTEGYLVYRPDPERMDAFMGQFSRFMALRHKPNRDKRIAIVYFKTPGKDALLASGMEVVPSLYNFLLRLRREGYDVSGLPATLDGFRRQLTERGSVMGSYAPAAQERFMDECDPVWVNASTYEEWAHEALLPGKYAEVTARYGEAPGAQLARGDSLAMAMMRYGNILIFPQPRPALGDDEFKMVHGAKVAPPHSYLAPYLYMQKKFDPDALIHFGTHGNLEFTPGKNAALSQADWAEALVGPRPHFYFYTTANVGEAVIAKRRSHAVMVTHLTPPYTETGLLRKYSTLLEHLHQAIANPATANTPALKKEIIALGLHRDLKLDSTATGTYTTPQLEEIDSYAEELAAEKVAGANYVMGEPYDEDGMRQTLAAILADSIAYERASRDAAGGKVGHKQIQSADFLRHHYLPAAREAAMNGSDPAAVVYRSLLERSAGAEIEAMVGALSGQPVRPAPGGDPVLNPNVLPTGRNMYGVNAEATPDQKAWADGVNLADATVARYLQAHGEYPRKVSYSLWAGEFISTRGATLAQAFRMLGVEPVRDSQGRVMDLRLTPSAELGRPRINVMIQVSGQLRDIASSRLLMLTEAVRLASEATGDLYPNYVAEGTVAQEKRLVDNGLTPSRARQLSVMRVFGPVNSGYSTGMLRYTENSGEWDNRSELAEGYVNNMCALYGDTASWGTPEPETMRAAVSGTDVIVQPRQSNTWGPVSLDHVYEFTGGLSNLCVNLDGREPDAVMADYRNPRVPALQDAARALAVELRATYLNPEVIAARMKGDAGAAQQFGEAFRNIFGWSVMRPSALTTGLYDELYDTYVTDHHGLGLEEWFMRVNPAALQEITATMLESARKGYWNPSETQLQATATLHARVTSEAGAPCTEFVCGNRKLQQYISRQLPEKLSQNYSRQMEAAVEADSGNGTLMRRDSSSTVTRTTMRITTPIAITLTAITLIITALILYRRRTRR